MKGKGEASL